MVLIVVGVMWGGVVAWSTEEQRIGSETKAVGRYSRRYVRNERNCDVPTEAFKALNRCYRYPDVTLLRILI